MTALTDQERLALRAFIDSNWHEFHIVAENFLEVEEIDELVEKLDKS